MKVIKIINYQFIIINKNTFSNIFSTWFFRVTHAIYRTWRVNISINIYIDKMPGICFNDLLGVTWGLIKLVKCLHSLLILILP